MARIILFPMNFLSALIYFLHVDLYFQLFLENQTVVYVVNKLTKLIKKTIRCYERRSVSLLISLAPNFSYFSYLHMQSLSHVLEIGDGLASTW